MKCSNCTYEGYGFTRQYDPVDGIPIYVCPECGHEPELEEYEVVVVGITATKGLPVATITTKAANHRLAILQVSGIDPKGFIFQGDGEVVDIVKYEATKK